MFGIGEITAIVVISAIANLGVEIAAEIIAEWWVNSEANEVALAGVDLGQINAELCANEHGEQLAYIMSMIREGTATAAEATQSIIAICNQLP